MTTIITGSKPNAIDALRATWRKTQEHYQAQALRFFGILGGLLGGKVTSEILDGKAPFHNLITAHDWLMYLLPVVVVAYRQWKPALGAKALDSAPGATIVPEQVGLASAGTVDVPEDPIVVQTPIVFPVDPPVVEAPPEPLPVPIRPAVRKAPAPRKRVAPAATPTPRKKVAQARTTPAVGTVKKAPAKNPRKKA